MAGVYFKILPDPIFSKNPFEKEGMLALLSLE